jgi:hypothetical protein
MEFMINHTFGNRSNIKEILQGNNMGLKSEEATLRTTRSELFDLAIVTSCPIRKEVRLRCDCVSLREDTPHSSSKRDQASQFEG